MSNLNQSKFSKFLSSKGFYIALAVCIVGTGAAAWVAIDSTMSSITAQDEKKLKNSPPVSSVAPKASEPDWGFGEMISGPEVTTKDVEKKKEDVPVEKQTATPSPDSSSSSSEERKASSSSDPSEAVLKPSEKQPVSPVPQPLAFTLPIMSEVFSPFSGGELVKNKTLNDWRTHDGIDIKSEKGTPVMACADGIVSNIYDDALWGTCMEIEHGGGLTSVYCGLDKASVTLKMGDEVKVKSNIGTLDKIPCEISLDNHLHFGMKQAGKWVNPVQVMGLD